MKVLICTHHLHSWAGSELVAIELFEEFQRQGHQTTVFCPFVRPVVLQPAFRHWTSVVQDPGRIDMADYDIIIVLHQAAARFLHLQEEGRLNGKHRPYFVFLHLSPYEPFEAPGLCAQRHLADMVLANSEETREVLGDYGYQNVELFENPAPLRFVADQEPPSSLNRILSVSNHVPEELSEALILLRKRGHEVYRIGSPDNSRRLQPYDLFEADAVIAIGKTVQYALRARRPVYCYDHFKGPGWIDREYDRNLWSNFSGRCSRTPRSPEELADDIEAGYASARDWVRRSQAQFEDKFALEKSVTNIVTAASKSRHLDRGIEPARVEDFRTQLKLEKAIYSQIDRAYEEQFGIQSLVVPKLLHERPESEAIESVMIRAPGPEEAMVIAIFSFRYDAHLVPALLENITPIVHGYVCWDDRLAPADDIFTDEPARRKALFQSAQSMGADWILPVDPDERFEDALAEKITDMTTKFGLVVWAFEFREMFTPQTYRVDGIWSAKARVCLFPCRPGMEPDDRTLHGRWTRNALNLPTRHTGLNIYHLRMATPERRALRHVQYAVLDPERAYQQWGYDYLADERGAQLISVSHDRGFSPNHAEDQGLWAADQSLPMTDISPDPVDIRLSLLMETLRRSGYASALYQVLDLLKRHPDDLELTLLAADCAMRARKWTMATELAEEVVGKDSKILMAQLILTRSLHAMGDTARAESALERAEALVPGSRFCARERELLRCAPSRFTEKDALWRQWATGHAEIHAGSLVAQCDLSVIVLSMAAPESLAKSVASLCEQSILPEIVVVNSGGGDVRACLGDLVEKVRVINVEERHYPGAVRNIGIDASSGQYVAFLASDCTALPGSIEKRLSLHRAGARAVSAFVIPEDEGSIFQRAASMILHSTRHPKSGLAADKKYSLSYDRDLFEDFGYFLPGLRVSEDTFFNNELSNKVPIASDKEICISHRYPETRASLKQDMEQRAHYRMKSPLTGGAADIQDLMVRTSNMRDVRYETTMRILELRKEEFDDTSLGELEPLISEMLDVERNAALRHGKDVLHSAELRAKAKRASDTEGNCTESLLREAARYQPHTPWPQLELALHLLSRGERTDRHEALQRLQLAVDSSLGEPKLLRAQIRSLLEIGEDEAARRAFERACLLFPRRVHIWAAYSELQTAANRPLRVFCLQKMFFGDFSDTNVAWALSQNHFLSGNWAARQARARNSAIQLPHIVPSAFSAASRSLFARSKSAFRRLWRPEFKAILSRD